MYMGESTSACAHVAGSGENCELAGSLLYTSEKSRAVRKKMPCLSEGYELSVAIDKNVKNKWQWIQEVDAVGVLFRHWCQKFDEPRVATKKLYKKTMKRRKELGSEVDIRSFFKKPRVN